MAVKGESTQWQMYSVNNLSAVCGSWNHFNSVKDFFILYFFLISSWDCVHPFLPLLLFYFSFVWNQSAEFSHTNLINDAGGRVVSYLVKELPKEWNGLLLHDVTVDAVLFVVVVFLFFVPLIQRLSVTQRSNSIFRLYFQSLFHVGENVS